MAWVIGIDEAGYGPNLGPFVMSLVACRVPDALAGTDLWDALRPAVRRGCDRDDGSLLVDDSKVVYSSARGLTGLERGVHAALGVAAPHLHALVEHACADDATELRGETWYHGTSPLPCDAPADEIAGLSGRFAGACADAGVGDWRVCTVVVCPPRFNALADAAGSKGAVLGDSMGRLLRCGRSLAEGRDPVAVCVDKHGGRNAYAALIQHALPDGVVLAECESMARSEYRVEGLGRDVRLTFRPRADSGHFCVALASMASKYLRELFMREFNAFWQGHVPGLKATAGYPGDAARFLEAIRPAAARLGIAEDRLWRKR